LVGVVRDISERKRVEKEKKELKERLVRSQKMESLGLLAGGVAHDLNNVLSGIVSYPDLLLMDLPEDSPLRKPILTIQKSGQKAADIVQDLLTLARRGVSITEVLSLNEMILDYLKSPEYHQLLNYNPALSVETNLENALLNIKGSPIHLKKAIMNLVSNAAEAQSSCGKIVISTYNKYIDMPIKEYEEIREGDYAVLEVADNGTGIADEDLSRIFEPFYSKKVMGRSGTGLGMAVVWGSVQDHNGYINVESTVGEGTTFYLYFPVIREKLLKEKDLISIKDYMGNNESILVVDDIKEQREIATNLLSRLNYSVSAVSSGEAALEYLKTNTADLLLLDMIMDPGLDGLDTFKKIIADHPHQKALIASGFSETDRVKEAQKIGVGQYIKKPYTLEKIGIAVKKELKNELVS
jgi:nitrogen-specific signal transduction histidine kinase/ActR/RegA family two-component response regulator